MVFVTNNSTLETKHVNDMRPPNVPIERSDAERTDEEPCEYRDGPIVALVAAVLMSLGGYSLSLLSYFYFGWSWWMVIAAFMPGAFFVGLLFYTLRFLARYKKW